jgi:molybdate transport system permease protein
MFRLVEALEWEKAHLLAGGLVIFAFVTVLGLLVFDRRTRRVGR